MEENLELLKSIIRTSSDLKPRIGIDDLNLKTKFSEDMGFDSMAMMSLIYELQEKFPDLDETEAIGIESIEKLIPMLK